MPALFPMTVAAEDFAIGQPVKWFISDRQVSPYVGIVAGVHPQIQKVSVVFPIGGLQQRAPEELVPLTPYSDVGVNINLLNHDRPNFYTDYMLEQNRKFNLDKGVSGKMSRIASLSAVANIYYSSNVFPILREVSYYYNKRASKKVAFEKLAEKYCPQISEGSVLDAVRFIYDSKTANSPFNFKTVLNLVFDTINELDEEKRRKDIRDYIMLIINGTNANIFTKIDDLFEGICEETEKEKIVSLLNQIVLRAGGDSSIIMTPEQFVEEEEKKEEKESKDLERFKSPEDDND